METTGLLTGFLGYMVGLHYWQAGNFTSVLRSLGKDSLVCSLNFYAHYNVQYSAHYPNYFLTSG